MHIYETSKIFIYQILKPNETYEIGSVSKCYYIRYSPAEISTMKTANSQTFIKIPREDSGISWLNSYFDLNFDVILVTDMQMVMI